MNTNVIGRAAANCELVATHVANTSRKRLGPCDHLWYGLRQRQHYNTEALVVYSCMENRNCKKITVTLQHFPMKKTASQNYTMSFKMSAE